MVPNKLSIPIEKIISALDADSVVADKRLHSAGRAGSELDRWIPFVFLHAGCLLVLYTGASWVSLAVCAGSYLIRMFAITGFYHRYFSHRSFRTTRAIQFLFAFVGSMSVQRGPLWWAAHHRQHHKSSDTDDDVHSPVARSFIWSHMAWITSTKNMATDYSMVGDFARFPELRFLNRFDWLGPAVLIVSLLAAGEFLKLHAAWLHTDGLQLLAWGFFVSTAILFHATSAINSVAHLHGYRRYDTPDNSRNNPLLALITLGEGWHNNHHKYSHCTRQGFAWWEIDITYYGLVLLKILGLISDLKPVPEGALDLAPQARR